MKLKKPFVGIIAFAIVLLTMPLGHALMIIMEKTLGKSHLFASALGLGFVGVAFLLLGMINSKKLGATFQLFWDFLEDFSYGQAGLNLDLSIMLIVLV